MAECPMACVSLMSGGLGKAEKCLCSFNFLTNLNKSTFARQGSPRSYGWKLRPLLSKEMVSLSKFLEDRLTTLMSFVLVTVSSCHRISISWCNLPLPALLPLRVFFLWYWTWVFALDFPCVLFGSPLKKSWKCFLFVPELLPHCYCLECYLVMSYWRKLRNCPPWYCSCSVLCSVLICRIFWR